MKEQVMGVVHPGQMGQMLMLCFEATVADRRHLLFPQLVLLNAYYVCKVACQTEAELVSIKQKQSW